MISYFGRVLNFCYGVMVAVSQSEERKVSRNGRNIVQPLVSE